MDAAGSRRSKVVVRPPKPSDKEPLLAFIRQIWHGHDYIPHVWDEWMKDPSGRMFVVEVDGNPVGMNRVRVLEDGSAWFEGARVHPDYRGMGLATALGDNSMKVARRMGARVFRLTSDARNKVAHGQVAKMQFKEVVRVSVLSPKKGRRFRPQRGVDVADPSDLDRVKATIRGSDEYRAGAGMLWDGLTAVALTDDVIEKRVAEGLVRVSGGAVAIAAPAREGREVWHQVGFLGGDAAAGVRIAKDILSKSRADWNPVFVPSGAMERALKKEGMKKDTTMVLFERRAKG